MHKHRAGCCWTYSLFTIRIECMAYKRKHRSINGMNGISKMTKNQHIIKQINSNNNKNEPASERSKWKFQLENSKLAISLNTEEEKKKIHTTSTHWRNVAKERVKYQLNWIEPSCTLPMYSSQAICLVNLCTEPFRRFSSIWIKIRDTNAWQQRQRTQSEV